MSGRSRQIQSLIGTIRVPQFENVPSLVGFGTMFPPAIEELYPANSGSPTTLEFVMPTWANGQPKIEWLSCPFCGESHAQATMRYIKSDDLFVCKACYESHVVECYECADETVIARCATSKYGRVVLLCAKCKRNHYVECEVCGKVVNKTTYESTNGKCMCQTCNDAFNAENHYCRGCNIWVPKTHTLMLNGSPRCIKCFIKGSKPPLPIKACLPYSRTGGSAFFSTLGGTVEFLGVEVEGQNGRYPNDQDQHDRTFAERLWHFKECFRKTDGSVPRGHEIATLPMELEYHKKFFNWKGLCELHMEYGFKGHDDPKAGMHIHISKNVFGTKATSVQKMKIAKLLYLLQKADWRNNWKKFSRRNCQAVKDAIADGSFCGSPWGYCEWYSIDEATPIIDAYAYAVDDNEHNRNRVLNFWTYDDHNRHVIAKTVEWRMNKSTYDYKSIHAALEMFSVLSKVATSKVTEQQLRDMTWKQLCKKIPNGYSDLINYLKTKKLWGV